MAGLAKKSSRCGLIFVPIAVALILLVGSGGFVTSYAIPIDLSSLTPETPGHAHYSKGVGSLTTGDYQQAEAEFEETRRLDPNLVEPLIGLADAAQRKGQFKQAEKYLQQALTQTPQNAAVHTAWGRFLIGQKRFKEAELALKHAGEVDPRAISPRVNLGDLYQFVLRKPKEAIETYRQVVALNPAHAGVHYKLGIALTMTGQIEMAQSELAEAGRLAPTNPLPLNALGHLHLALKEYDQALDAFATALKAQPTFIQAHMARGDIFLATGKGVEALTEYSAALKIAPKFAPAQVKIGMVHERHNRIGEAEQAYLAAIELDPKQAIAYNNLAWLAAQQKIERDQALTWAKRAVELAPQVPQFQDTLGWLYRARGDLDQAISVLKRAATLKPQHAETLYHLGVAYDDKGNRKEAKKALSQALALNQDFPGAEDARRRLETLSTVSSRSTERQIFSHKAPQ